MKKKKQRKYEDDGHTIFNMNVDAYWSRGKKTNEETNVSVSKEEKRQIIMSALIAYLPRVLLILLCFLIAMVIIYFWLN